MAGGLDGQLKILAADYEEGQSIPTLRVAYKVKVPEEITCMDVAVDGSHYALGMAGGALLIKSKRQGADAEDEDNETEE